MVSLKQKKSVAGFFDSFAESYDNTAFYNNLGTRYVSEIDEKILKKYIENTNDSSLHILDIGVGTGRNIALFKSYPNAEITGIDISEKMMKKAREKYSDDPRIKLLKSNLAEKNDFEKDYFDIMLCIRVIKYINNWPHFLEEVHKILKPGGVFVLEISNLYSVQFFGRNKKCNYSLFKLEEVLDILRKTGFSLINIEGGLRIPFPLYRKCNSEGQLAIMKALETTLRLIFGKKLFSRNLFIICKK